MKMTIEMQNRFKPHNLMPQNVILMANQRLFTDSDKQTKEFILRLVSDPDLASLLKDSQHAGEDFPLILFGIILDSFDLEYKIQYNANAIAALKSFEETLANLSKKIPLLAKGLKRQLDNPAFGVHKLQINLHEGTRDAVTGKFYVDHMNINEQKINEFFETPLKAFRVIEDWLLIAKKKTASAKAASKPAVRKLKNKDENTARRTFLVKRLKELFLSCGVKSPHTLIAEFANVVYPSPEKPMSDDNVRKMTATKRIIIKRKK